MTETEILSSAHLLMIGLTYIYLNTKVQHLPITRRVTIAVCWPLLVVSLLFDVVMKGYKK